MYYYPEPPMEDIEKICGSINFELYNSKEN